ncbi:MAG: hypothetical protein CL878_05745 [Dehalococcoidia bacterium]|nr:hypothetical protein [Dehalococcoidia bacterium]
MVLTGLTLHAVGIPITVFRWWLVFLVCLLLLFLRRPDALLNAQPWAEDAQVFLQHALNTPWSVFKPHLGYLLVLPHITANLGLLFGLTQAPLVMNASALVLAAISAAFITSTSFRFLIQSHGMRLLVAFFIVGFPGPHVLNGTMTMSQWYLNIWLILFVALIVFRYRSYDRASHLYRAAVALFGGLVCVSTPMALPMASVLLAVVVAVAMRGTGSRASQWYLLIPIGASVFHGIAYLVNSVSRAAPLQDPLLSLVRYWSTAIATRLVYGDVGELVRNMGFDITYWIGAAVLLLLIVGMRYLTYEDIYLVLTVALFMAVVAIGNPGYLNDLANGTLLAVRYAVAPVVALCILAARLCERNGRMGAIIFVPIMANVLVFFPLRAYPNLQFAAFAADYRRDGADSCPIPVHPARAWTLVIPCAHPPWAELNNAGSALFAVDRHRTVETHRGLDRQLVVTGWAVDRKTGRPASRVYIVRGGKVLGRAIYGTKRPDVARQLSNEAYVHSGFEAHFNRAPARQGSITLRIVSHDGTAYYETESILGDHRALDRFIAGELLPGTTFGQTITANKPRLNGISVRLATYLRPITSTVAFRLRASPESTQDIIRVQVAGQSVRNNLYYTFSFPPIPDSAGKPYYWFVESPDARRNNAITVWGNRIDTYPFGRAFRNGRPIAGDFHFRAFYDG